MTLQRKTKSTISVQGTGGKNKEVQVEVRKTRTYVKRSALEDEQRQAEAEEKARLEAEEKLVTRPRTRLVSMLKRRLAVRLSRLVVKLRKRRGSRHNQRLDRLHSPPK